LTAVTIRDAADPRLSPYRAIRERDHTRGGTFVAEGEVVVRRLLAASRFRAASVLVTPPRLAALVPLLESLAAPPPVYVASEALVSSIAGFPLHRDCLAIGERGEALHIDMALGNLPARAAVLAAFGIANHDNVGALFRNAAALGAGLVALDRQSCDPLYRKAIRVSTGAVLSLPFVHAHEPLAILDRLEAHGIAQLALAPRGGEPIDGLARPARFALVVGAEGPGLPDAVLARCRRVTIPMAEGIDSLNVATAAAIALARLRHP